MAEERKERFLSVSEDVLQSLVDGGTSEATKKATARRLRVDTAFHKNRATISVLPRVPQTSAATFCADSTRECGRRERENTENAATFLREQLFNAASEISDDHLPLRTSRFAEATKFSMALWQKKKKGELVRN